MILHDKDYSIGDKVTLPIKNINYPLDKIFGGISGGSRTFPTLQ